MTDREKLIELVGVVLTDALMEEECYPWIDDSPQTKGADYLIANGVTVQKCPRPLEEWGEDYGDVLWWKFPIEEPPYVGSPLDENWPNYHTHWTPLVVPEPPKEEQPCHAVNCAAVRCRKPSP